MPRIGKRVASWLRCSVRLFGAGICLPWVVSPLLAAQPDCSRYQTDERTCLACNIYHESRNQPEEGQLAVAMVTLNRLASPDYPDTICEVVWEQRRDRRTGRMVAQFSWTLDGRPDEVSEPAAWAAASRLASEALAQAGRGRSRHDPSLGALFFHADYVQPDWRNDPGMTLVARIGNHLFYDRKTNDTAPRSAWRAKARTMAAWAPAPPANAERPSPPTLQGGAKLISLRPGAGGLLDVTIVEGGRVQRMTVTRESKRRP